jgi:hypothetical protein
MNANENMMAMLAQMAQMLVSAQPAAQPEPAAEPAAEPAKVAPEHTRDEWLKADLAARVAGTAAKSAKANGALRDNLQFKGLANQYAKAGILTDGGYVKIPSGAAHYEALAADMKISGAVNVARSAWKSALRVELGTVMKERGVTISKVLTREGKDGAKPGIYFAAVTEDKPSMTPAEMAEQLIETLGLTKAKQALDEAYKAKKAATGGK